MKFSLPIVFLLLALPAWAEESEQVFERARAAVVSIETRDEQRQPEAQGSGVVIGREQVVTNCHVVDEAASVRVTWQGSELAATLQRRDATRDLCLLAVPGLRAKPVALRKRAQLRVGETAYAVGNPLGLGLAISAGLVSALPRGEREAGIYTSAPMSPGSSGGGLFDAEGRLIGITTSVFSYGQNFNYALPADWVEELEQRAQAVAPAALPPPEPDWQAESEKLHGQNDWVALERHAERWLAVYPSSGQALVSRGSARLNQGQQTEAMRDFLRAIECDPNLTTPRADLVLVLTSLKRYAEAREEVRRLLTITHEQDASAWTLLGQLEYQSGQPVAARAAYETAARLSPGNAMNWSWIGHIQFERKELDAAEKSFRIALRLKPDDADTRKRLAQLQMQRGKTAEAAELLGSGAASQPNSANAWNELGVLEAGRKRIAEAESAWLKAVELDPKLASAWANLGRLQHILGRFEAARTSLTRTVQLQPDLAVAWDLLAATQVSLGLPGDAETSWQTLTQLTPDDPAAWLKLGAHRLATNKSAAAVFAMKRVTKLQPGNAVAWTGLATAYFSLGRMDDAYAAAQQAIGLNPKDPRTLEILANIHGLRGEFPKALEFQDTIIKLSPGVPSHWSNKGYTLLKMGRLDDAVRAFETAIRLQADFANAWINLGEARLRQGRLGQAIETLEHAVVLAPRAQDARLHLGDAFMRMKQPEKARTQWLEASRINPRNPAVWRHLADAYWAAGDKAAAFKAIDQLEMLDIGAALSLRSSLQDKAKNGRKTGKAKPSG